MFLLLVPLVMPLWMIVGQGQHTSTGVVHHPPYGFRKPNLLPMIIRLTTKCMGTLHQ
ncbi:hypothetical protein ACHAWC_001402 [Mediolabrus comicus]